MRFQRKRTTSRKTTKRRQVRPKTFKRKGNFASLARQVRRITSTIETKSGVQTFPDGLELNHNRIVAYSSEMLRTGNGTTDLENAFGTRIGDKISLQRVQVKGMLELNERYSDVGIKVMVVKSAKGDAPNDSNLWQGASANKLLDTFNTERFTIIHSKFIKMKAPNMSIQASGVQTIGSGFTQGGTEHIQSRATRMFNISIPGKKFTRNGVLQYENGSTQPKFFDYHLLFFAYSNFSTSDTLGYNVARVNDAFVKIHYKDA